MNKRFTALMLSIVGIPLSVHGKKLMNLALQVSENGPGVAVKF